MFSSKKIQRQPAIDPAPLAELITRLIDCLDGEETEVWHG
jgi:hypothetical protein